MIAQKKTVGKRRQSHAPESCSAIIATGNQTADGKIVVCHTAWDDYLPGQRMNMIIDMKPEKGNRVIMDSMPGLIHSLTDFYVNSAGLIGVVLILAVIGLAVGQPEQPFLDDGIVAVPQREGET